MAQERKFQDVKTWKELQTMVELGEVLQALKQAEYQKNYRKEYNKRKNLTQKLLRQKIAKLIAEGKITQEEVDAELNRVA